MLVLTIPKKRSSKKSTTKKKVSRAKGKKPTKSTKKKTTKKKTSKKKSVKKTMNKRNKIAAGFDYVRSINGLTLVRTIKTDAGVTTSLITMTDEEFDKIAAIQQRHRGQGDPSLTAGDLNRVDDYGYGQGGEV